MQITKGMEISFWCLIIQFSNILNPLLLFEITMVDLTVTFCIVSITLKQPSIFLLETSRPTEYFSIFENFYI
ncbi:hypothetical protein D3C84_702940 [compost metagenome]